MLFVVTPCVWAIYHLPCICLILHLVFVWFCNIYFHHLPLPSKPLFLLLLLSLFVVAPQRVSNPATCSLTQLPQNFHVCLKWNLRKFPEESVFYNFIPGVGRDAGNQLVWRELCWRIWQICTIGFHCLIHNLTIYTDIHWEKRLIYFLHTHLTMEGWWWWEIR